MFFNTSIETQDGDLILKRKSLAKLTEIKETLDFSDIWRIRNLNRSDLLFIKTTFPAVYKADWITF